MANNVNSEMDRITKNDRMAIFKAIHKCVKDELRRLGYRISPGSGSFRATQRTITFKTFIQNAKEE